MNQQLTLYLPDTGVHGNRIYEDDELKSYASAVSLSTAQARQAHYVATSAAPRHITWQGEPQTTGWYGLAKGVVHRVTAF